MEIYIYIELCVLESYYLKVVISWKRYEGDL